MKPKATTIIKESKQKITQSLNKTKQNYSRTSLTSRTVSRATQTNPMMSAAANPDTDAGLQYEEIFLKIVQEGKIGLLFEDMIHVSPSFGKFLRSFITCSRSRTTAQSTARVGSVGAYRTSNKKLYVASTPHTQVHLNKEICKALIDTGTEINVMIEEAQDQFNLPVRLDPALWLISHTGYRWNFVGVYKNVNVSVGGVTTKQNIFVVNSINHVLILGTPFMIKAQARMDWDSSGHLIMICHLLDGYSMAVCKVLNRDQFSGSMKAKLFPFKSLNKTVVIIPG